MEQDNVAPVERTSASSANHALLFDSLIDFVMELPEEKRAVPSGADAGHREAMLARHMRTLIASRLRNDAA